MSKNTSVTRASKNKNPQQLAQFSRKEIHIESSPLLIKPEQLEILTKYKPDIVDIVVSEAIEANKFNRDEIKKTNQYIHIERKLGMNYAFSICIIGVIGGFLVSFFKGSNYALFVSLVSILAALGLPFLKKEKKSS